MRTLVLVAPKGCGKTFIGRSLENELPNASFFDVESIAMNFIEQSGGSAESFNDDSWRASFFDHMRCKIQELASRTPADSILIMETTGAAPETKLFLSDIEQFGPVYLFRIRASALTCASRIRSRDASKQVEVSQEILERLHTATEALDWNWDLMLVNDSSACIKEILERISIFLQDKAQKKVPLEMPTCVYQNDFSPARGNALQAAVASIFGLSLDKVPNFIEMEEGYEAAVASFYQQVEKGGCHKVQLDGVNNESTWSYTSSEIKQLKPAKDLETIIKSIKEESCEIPEEYNSNVCILRGKSPRGDFGHVVVAKHVAKGEFEMLHDPHPDGTYLDTNEAFGWCLFFI